MPTKAWKHLREATLDGFRVKLRSCRVSRGRRLVEFGYPGRDGEEHEDLGARGARVDADVVFFGTDYRDEYETTVETMNLGSVVTFVHPHHGELRVRVKDIEDTTGVQGARLIEARLSLVESVLDQVGFAREPAGVPGAIVRLDEAVADGLAAAGAL